MSKICLGVLYMVWYSLQPIPHTLSMFLYRKHIIKINRFWQTFSWSVQTNNTPVYSNIIRSKDIFWVCKYAREIMSKIYLFFGAITSKLGFNFYISFNDDFEIFGKSSLWGSSVTWYTIHSLEICSLRVLQYTKTHCKYLALVSKLLTIF